MLYLTCLDLVVVAMDSYLLFNAALSENVVASMESFLRTQEQQEATQILETDVRIARPAQHEKH